MKVSLLSIVWVMLIITACASSPTKDLEDNTPITSSATVDTSAPEKPAMTYAPQPSDENLLRGSIFIKKTGLIIRESMPPQISLEISGDLPTPCHLFRAKISPPDLKNKIVVEAYSVVDPNDICLQVLSPFHENVDLGTFPTGHYSVWMNEELIGEFDS